MNKNIVWIALQYEPRAILGIFDLESDAVAACSDLNHVIGPIEMNTALSGEWIGAYYPLDTERDNG